MAKTSSEKRISKTEAHKKWKSSNQEKANKAISKWRNKNKEKVKGYGRDFYSKNKDKCKSNQNKWRKNNRQTYLLSQKNSALKLKYGISIDEYNEKLTLQNGCCAICKKHQSKFKKSFAVDHSHTTGLVRALLCHRCNTGLGQFMDNKKLLREAIKYLNLYSKKKQNPIQLKLVV